MYYLQKVEEFINSVFWIGESKEGGIKETIKQVEAGSEHSDTVWELCKYKYGVSGNEDIVVYSAWQGHIPTDITFIVGKEPNPMKVMVGGCLKDDKYLGVYIGDKEIDAPYSTKSLKVLSDNRITFEDGGRLLRCTLDTERDVFDFAGMQITTLYWEDLNKHSQFQFLYMLSRVRTEGIVPCSVIAHCKEDKEHFGDIFLTNFTDKSEYGRVCYMCNVGGELHTSFDREELEKIGEYLISFTVKAKL